MQRLTRHCVGHKDDESQVVRVVFSVLFRPHRMHRINAGYCYRWTRVVCLFWAYRCSLEQTAETIEMPFRVRLVWAQGTCILDVISTTWRIIWTTHTRGDATLFQISLSTIVWSSVSSTRNWRASDSVLVTQLTRQCVFKWIQKISKPSKIIIRDLCGSNRSSPCAFCAQICVFR